MDLRFRSGCMAALMGCLLFLGATEGYAQTGDTLRVNRDTVWLKMKEIRTFQNVLNNGNLYTRYVNGKFDLDLYKRHKVLEKRYKMDSLYIIDNIEKLKYWTHENDSTPIKGMESFKDSVFDFDNFTYFLLTAVITDGDSLADFYFYIKNQNKYVYDIKIYRKSIDYINLDSYYRTCLAFRVPKNKNISQISYKKSYFYIITQRDIDFLFKLDPEWADYFVKNSNIILR